MPSHASPAWRSEALANLRLALPLIAAQLAGVGMGTVDTVFAGRLGARALAAVALGVNVNVLFFIFCMGLLMAVSPIVAHRRAVDRSDGDLAGLRRSALKLALLAGALWCLGLNLLAPWIAARTGVDGATAVLAVHSCARCRVRASAFRCGLHCAFSPRARAAAGRFSWLASSVCWSTPCSTGC
jgi:Na+-driven multidrug efflux pump